MPVLLRRLARSRGVLIFLTAMLITGLAAAPLLPVYSSPEATSKMAAIPRRSANEVGPAGPSSGSGSGLQVTLSEGSEQVTPVEAVEPAPATPLDDATIQTISDRLPPLETGATHVQDFRLPAETILPPRTGQTITTTFPATGTETAPEGVTAGPLEVLRYSPEGEIPIAPFLSVTFNQPMVPLATVEQLAAADVPVTLTPSIPGIWRWVGTRTLTFEYAGDPREGGDNQAFPMATVFTAEVPAGTRSATGEELAEPVSWTFSTPAPRSAILDTQQLPPHPAHAVDVCRVRPADRPGSGLGDHQHHRRGTHLSRPPGDRRRSRSRQRGLVPCQARR